MSGCARAPQLSRGVRQHGWTAMVGLTKDTISQSSAKWWILGAVFMATFSGLVTIFAATKGLLGFTHWNWLDAGVCFGLAYGVYRRSLVCAWILLGYHLVNRLLLFIDAGVVPSFRSVTYLLFYSMAIVCIGLYPRSANADKEASSSDGPGESNGAARVV